MNRRQRAYTVKGRESPSSAHRQSQRFCRCSRFCGFFRATSEPADDIRGQPCCMQGGILFHISTPKRPSCMVDTDRRTNIPLRCFLMAKGWEMSPFCSAKNRRKSGGKGGKQNRYNHIDKDITIFDFDHCYFRRGMLYCLQKRKKRGKNAPEDIKNTRRRRKQWQDLHSRETCITARARWMR